MGIFPQLLFYIPLSPLFFYSQPPSLPFTVHPMQYLLPHTLSNIHASLMIGWLNIIGESQLSTIMDHFHCIFNIPAENQKPCFIHPCVLIPGIALDASWANKRRGKARCLGPSFFAVLPLASLGWLDHRIYLR